MISSRLTKTQKAEILESYKDGDSPNSLAERYSCTTNTINRTVKTLLTESEYKLLKEKRSNISKKKVQTNDNDVKQEKKEDLEHSTPLISIKEKVKDRSKVLEEELDNTDVRGKSTLALEDADDFGDELVSENQYNKNHDYDINISNIDNNFEVIEPLLSVYDFDQDKQKSDYEILNYESLPEIVYMIVDKKIELDLQLISDLPEWNFLPENELKRNAILLFANQRAAKRSCSKNQRVIKIPNTSVFKLSKSYLISKGITRLILEDSIIALDN
tara:strand:- start:511 stop:1329 length:819 start_codon:yes stop_codon:yes gene_type:complete